MATTFYFYDLETSGFNPRQARIMQFAGQRTDAKLQPIGEPDNLLVKLTDDVLPEPDAVLVHGISPRLTQGQGISEPELCHYLASKVFRPDTIAVGFNNIRFDDEFIRHLFWRNFYDAYEWQWKDGRSKWDLLDASRMVRALRPAGVEWPFAPDGKASNRLELLSSINKIQHDAVHDALSDVRAMIAFAQLIKSKQPKLFSYMLKMRDKKQVEKLVKTGHPFVYVSGRYPSEFEKATVAVMLAPQTDRGAYVYDLRTEPTKYLSMSPAEIAKCWRNRDPEADYFPIKSLTFNKCPTVAPINILDEPTRQRLKLDMAEIQANLNQLLKAKGFADKVRQADELLKPKKQPAMLVDEQEIDGLLYDGFVEDPADRTRMSAVRALTPGKLSNFKADFKDERLKTLLPIYKARQFPEALSADEKKWWSNYRHQKLIKSGWAARYAKRVEELLENPINSGQKNILLELRDYGRALVPKT